MNNLKFDYLENIFSMPGGYLLELPPWNFGVNKVVFGESVLMMDFLIVTQIDLSHSYIYLPRNEYENFKQQINRIAQ